MYFWLNYKCNKNHGLDISVKGKQHGYNMNGKQKNYIFLHTMDCCNLNLVPYVTWPILSKIYILWSCTKNELIKSMQKLYLIYIFLFFIAYMFFIKKIYTSIVGGRIEPWMSWGTIDVPSKVWFYNFNQ